MRRNFTTDYYLRIELLIGKSKDGKKNSLSCKCHCSSPSSYVRVSGPPKVKNPGHFIFEL